jgi:hypothetical protein
MTGCSLSSPHLARQIDAMRNSAVKAQIENEVHK